MKVDANNLITPSEFAKIKGVSAATITNGMNSGLIPFIQIRGGRLILLDEGANNYKPKRDKRRRSE